LVHRMNYGDEGYNQGSRNFFGREKQRNRI
jgi:hypothetical protein